MYNPKSKISLLLLSFIAIMIAEIQGESQQKQEVNKSEAKKETR